MGTALIITTYNRPELLKKCLDSVLALEDDPNLIYIIDDFSNNDISEIIKRFQEKIASKQKKYHEKYRTLALYHPKKENKGIKDSLKIGFESAFNEFGSDLAINLDPDSILKPNFIAELKRLKSLYPNHIVSGFNCDNPKNPVLIDNIDHVLRRHCNGINMCINKEQYETIVRPALLQPGNWDYNSSHKLPFVIAKPSLVQHLAPNDSTMGHYGGDVACDF